MVDTSMEKEQVSVPFLAVTAAVGAVVLLLVLLCGLVKKDDKENQQEEEEKKQPTSNGKKASQGARKKERHQPLKKKESRSNFTHPWLAKSLKGHSGSVLGVDFSNNGKYLATCGDDRTVLLWSVKEFTKKDHKSVRANIEFDHATKVRFSPDSKAFLVSLCNENAIRVLKFGKKDDGAVGNIQPSLEFRTEHPSEILNIGIASSGKFIMTSCKDTTLKIWDIKGELLATIETHQMNTSYSCVSPCGRFVASSGFTPDVKIWEVCFDKTGNFREVVRAFELKGHSAGVYSFGFSNDSGRMATVSKDGTWKFWDTEVEYQKSQDPYLLKTGDYNHEGPAMLALSPDGRTVAISSGLTIGIYDTDSMQCVTTLQDIFTGPVVAMEFNISNRYLAIAGDRHVHILHNVVGYKATIQDLEQQKKKASNRAHLDRLEQQIQEAKSALKSIEGTEKSQ